MRKPSALSTSYQLPCTWHWLQLLSVAYVSTSMRRLARLMSSVGAAPPICVTGGSGFLGSWCIKLLLEDGHHVHTTTRSATRNHCTGHSTGFLGDGSDGCAIHG